MICLNNSSHPLPSSFLKLTESSFTQPNPSKNLLSESLPSLQNPFEEILKDLEKFKVPLQEPKAINNIVSPSDSSRILPKGVSVELDSKNVNPLEEEKVTPLKGILINILTFRSRNTF